LNEVETRRAFGPAGSIGELASGGWRTFAVLPGEAAKNPQRAVHHIAGFFRPRRTTNDSLTRLHRFEARQDGSLL
jgi:hypothetical protein